MADYIEKEYNNLSYESGKRHVSSDIIESMFGAYKGRKSPNKMNGVTKHVFVLPFLTNIKKMKGGDFKYYLEKTILKDLDDWKILIYLKIELLCVKNYWLHKKYFDAL